MIICLQESPQSKRSRIQANGANLIVVDTYQDRFATCERLAKEKGLFYAKTADSMDVVAGQGTLALELLGQAGGDLDALVVPLNGGGMLAGCALAARASNPRCRVVAVEPEGKELAESLRAGERLWPTDPPRYLKTKAEGIKGWLVCQLIGRD